MSCDFDRLARVVRAAQAHQDVVVGLAGRDLIFEIELPGLVPMQRHGDERPEIAGIVPVDGAGYGPARGIVAGKEVDVVDLHLASL